MSHSEVEAACLAGLRDADDAEEQDSSLGGAQAHAEDIGVLWRSHCFEVCTLRCLARSVMCMQEGESGWKLKVSSMMARGGEERRRKARVEDKGFDEAAREVREQSCLS